MVNEPAKGASQMWLSGDATGARGWCAWSAAGQATTSDGVGIASLQPRRGLRPPASQWLRRRCLGQRRRSTAPRRCAPSPIGGRRARHEGHPWTGCWKVQPPKSPEAPRCQEGAPSKCIRCIRRLMRSRATHRSRRLCRRRAWARSLSLLSLCECTKRQGSAMTYEDERGAGRASAQ